MNNYGIINQSGRIEGGAKVVNGTDNQSSVTQQITNNGTIGNVVGKADAVHSQQNIGSPMPQSLAELGVDLKRLKAELASRAEGSKEFEEVAAVAQAEEASEKKDPEGVKSALARAGNWTLKIAQDIGTKLAVDAIKHSIGL